ncbi:MAG: N-acetyl sugar amidotransferase [Patescibacteria group bacterium]
MRYCQRCVVPENYAIPLTFDEQGVCSACRVHEEKSKINWQECKLKLQNILNQYRSHDGKNYDCIIPISGGKDSHYQVYLMKVIYKMNPLLVTFNHEMNTQRGIRNLANIVKKFEVDHLRFTPNPAAIKRLSIYSLKKMGDIFWHSHCGIYTYPVQIAVKYNIPLLIWGEQGFMDLGGMFSHYDMVEMTKKFRVEHGLRGYDWEDMLSDKLNIKHKDLFWAMYPNDDELEKAGIRGIYLGNFLPWNHKKHTELMIKEYGFETGPEHRSFNLYENVEDHVSNGLNDYLKFLKFGYGRATDHASIDIRFGRMTREEGIDMVMKYDHQEPYDIEIYMRYSGLTKNEIYKAVEKMREPRAWNKNKKGQWIQIDPIGNHIHDKGVNAVRLPLKKDRHYILRPNPPLPEPMEYQLM